MHSVTPVNFKPCLSHLFLQIFMIFTFNSVLTTCYLPIKYDTCMFCWFWKFEEQFNILRILSFLTTTMVSITIPFRIQLLPQCLCYKRVNKIYNLKTAILLYFTTELMKAILCIEDIQASSSSGELNFGTFFYMIG